MMDKKNLTLIRGINLASQDLVSSLLLPHPAVQLGPQTNPAFKSSKKQGELPTPEAHLSPVCPS